MKIQIQLRNKLFKIVTMPKFNPKRHYLGKLCTSQHNWNMTGKSLRYIKGRKCVQCLIKRSRPNPEYQKAYREANREKNIEYQKLYYSENREKALEYASRHRKLNREDRLISSKKYYFANRERFAHNHREWCRANRLTIAAIGARRRARKRECVSIPYSSEELSEKFTEFDGCAYCGAKGQLQIDHFIPIFLKGDDAIHNIVPACRFCNASKKNKNPLEWYSAQPFFSKERLEKILLSCGCPNQIDLDCQ